MKRKKIGILTYHRAINYGAFLQCYSLVSFLNKNLPDYKIEVIDYETPDEFIVRIKAFIKSILQGNGWQWLRMKQLFSRDMRKFLPLSKKRIISSKDNAIQQWFQNDYDAIIVGSDAVWNRYQKKAYLNFFLKDVKKTKKFSYAASTNGLDTLSIDASIKETLIKTLSTFVYIGVRESKGETFIKKLLPNTDVFHNCDPTCLIDLKSIECSFDMKRFLENNGVDLQKPIICLMTKNERVGEYVFNEYHSTHQIVSIYVPNKFSDKFLYNLSPIEFALLFKYVDMLFSFFFHGCYLCLMNNTPVIAVDEDKEPDGDITKINYLFRRLKMGDRYFRPNDMNDTQLKAMVSQSRIILEQSQKDLIRNALITEKTFSESFLVAIKEALY